MAKHHHDESERSNALARNYGYVIVGAGSAGCVVARRFIDSTDATVLLLEAGGSDEGVKAFRIHRNGLRTSARNMRSHPPSLGSVDSMPGARLKGARRP